MHLTAHLLTCAGREGVLAETLADFARTDWPGAPKIHRAPPEPGDPVGSTERGHLRLLRDWVFGSVPFIERLDENTLGPEPCRR